MMVSVIIPAFNEEKNISRVLASVKDQSYKKIETIVVDDGSTDKTVEIAKKYTNKVYKRKHAERSIQRNFGASKAKGSSVIFIDADMELTPRVVEDALLTAKKHNYKVIVIPERTVGENFIAKVRNFEREMYMGDLSIEVARFFDKKVFDEYGGYDPNLTGPEDYDLPYRISQKYEIGRSHEYILHHEENSNATLGKLLKRKYYYAKKGAIYAEKHPALISSQGNLLFRKAYIKNWKKFFKEPILAISFIFIRVLETIWAICGYVSAVGIIGFMKSLYIMLQK